MTLLSIITLCGPNGPRRKWGYTPPSWVERHIICGALYKDGGKTVGQRRREAILSNRNPYVMFVDDDDELLPGIEQVLPLLEKGAGAVSANVETVTPAGNKWMARQDNTGLSLPFAPRAEHWPVGIRVPIHRDLARLAAGAIPDMNWGEDQPYAKWMLSHGAATPWCGDEPIQRYYYDLGNSLTEGYKNTETGYKDPAR